MKRYDIEHTFFIEKLKEIEVCEGSFYFIEGSSLLKPTDFIRIKNEIHNLENCDTCKKSFQIRLNSLGKRFDKFPFCCDYHKNLVAQPWFRKEDYNEVPRLTSEKIYCTWDFILKYIDEENWEEEILDYIQYVVHTFGSFPKGMGSALFLDSYTSDLKDMINNVKDRKYDSKKLAIIKHLDSYFISKEKNKKKSKNDTDLNVLLGIYNQWYKTFPFELSIFSNLKKNFSASLPVFEKVHHNKYLNVSIATPITKNRLINLLESITEKIITEFNSLKLYEQGKLSDLDNYRLEIIIQKRKLKLKAGYQNNSKNLETRYRKILKEWLSDELEFIKEITPALKSIEVKNDNLFLDVVTACGKMQENKIFIESDENGRTRQILDLLSSKYTTKDQTQIGVSSTGKNSGSLDGMVIDQNRIEYFIEALNLSSLNKEYIKNHVNKLEKNYDSKGVINKYLIVYCNLNKSNSFKSFADKYFNYLNNDLEFSFQKINIENLESNYANQRIIKSTHLRESTEVSIYHILLKM